MRFSIVLYFCCLVCTDKGLKIETRLEAYFYFYSEDSNCFFYISHQSKNYFIIITHSKAKATAVIFFLLRNVVVSEKLSICLDAGRKIDRLMKGVPARSKLSK